MTEQNTTTVKQDTAKPWRAEVTVLENGGNGDRWYGNGLRFEDRDKAIAYAGDLASRWTAVTRWRAVDNTVPDHQEYKPGSEDGTYV